MNNRKTAVQIQDERGIVMKELTDLIMWATFFLLVLCVTGDKITEIHKQLRKEKRFTSRKGKSKNKNRQTSQKLTI